MGFRVWAKMALPPIPVPRSYQAYTPRGTLINGVASTHAILHLRGHFIAIDERGDGYDYVTKTNVHVLSRVMTRRDVEGCVISLSRLRGIVYVHAFSNNWMLHLIGTMTPLSLHQCLSMCNVTMGARILRLISRIVNELNHRGYGFDPDIRVIGAQPVVFPGLGGEADLLDLFCQCRMVQDLDTMMMPETQAHSPTEFSDSMSARLFVRPE